MQTGIIKIWENDDVVNGKAIVIGIDPISDPDYGSGYRVVASNGDDISYYKPQPKEKCIADIEAMYQGWAKEYLR